MKTGLQSVACPPSPRLVSQVGLVLSIIIPIRNEQENLDVLIERIQEAVADRAYEIVIVDDNREDGAWRVAEELSRRCDNIRVVRRINRKGLHSGVAEGFLLGKGQYLVVLDADLSHDCRLIGSMLDEIEDCDLVIGSRYLHKKCLPCGQGSLRSGMNGTGAFLARKLLKRHISDPMSGFFMIRRDIIQELAPRLFEQGCNILFDILVKCPGLNVKELPCEAVERQDKINRPLLSVIFDFADLMISQFIPSRFSFQFVRYGIVGASGVLVHLCTLYLLHIAVGLGYPVALVIAIETAMVSNYMLNNRWTFKEDRFFGLKWWRGLFNFNLACIVGAGLNLAISLYLVDKGIPWFYASILGIWVGTSWNYLSNRLVTWG